MFCATFYFTPINHSFFGLVSDLVLINVSMVKQYKGGEQAFVVKESVLSHRAGVEEYYSAVQANASPL